MPEKLSELLSKADYLSIMTAYGIAAVFGFLGGFGGCSVVLIKMRKFHRRLALALGLALSSAVVATVVFSGIFSYQFFSGKEIISSVDAVIHLSLVTGFFTSIFMMVVNRGLTKLAIKYKGLQIDLDFRGEQND